MCSNPYRQDGQEFSCYVCLSCRINRRRLWTARMMLEAAGHEYSSFVTLTYDEDHIPEDGCVSPRELGLFFKRLRRLLEPQKVRFFAVGEYGDYTERPHYHLALFGLMPADHVAPAVQLKTRVRCRCVICRAWTLGVVDVGFLNVHSAGYIAGYVLKYMTKKDDDRLRGRHPEFTRMSLRPGIGVKGAEEIARFVTSEEGSRFITRGEGVPSVIRFNGRRYSVGRYLRNRILVASGYAGQRLDRLRAPVDVPLEEWLSLHWRDRFQLAQVAMEEREEKRAVQALQARTKVRIFKSRKGVGL